MSKQSGESDRVNVAELQRELAEKERIIADQAARLRTNERGIEKIEEKKVGAEKQLKEAEAELENVELELAEQTLEVEQIAQIQTELLPSKAPQVPGFRLIPSYQALRDAGGDYYDFLPARQQDGTTLMTMIIADASGHGPAAAVVMAMMHSLLHAFVSDDTDPDQIMSHMNQELARKDLSTAMVTALVLELEPVSRRLRYACAGHHPPLLRRRDSSVVELECSGAGLPLAVDVEAEYGMDQTVIEPGEVVLLYTDGAIEIENVEGEEFGLQRLKHAMSEVPPDAVGLIDHVNHRIRSHRGGEDRTDDKTLLVIEALKQ